MHKEVDFPREESEFRGAWSQCAGRRAALGEVVGTINKKAADAFLRDSPVAHEFRALAREFEAREREASDELQAYIAEGTKRRGRSKP
jgi:hypothetical protein